MNNQNNIGKYLLGAIAGISLVVGCGGGSSGVNSAGATNIAGVTAQLFCTGFPSVMSGTPSAPYTLTCLSSTNATKQTFQDFYQITQQGWIMVEVSAVSGESAFLFQK